MIHKSGILRHGQSACGYAAFSEDMTYRYSLRRCWGDDSPSKCSVNFILLNPSTADHNFNDPTIRRCFGFANKWGMHELIVTNLFAIRATNPNEMLNHPSPVGLENDAHMLAIAKQVKMVVLGWGNHGTHMMRDKEVISLLRPHVKLLCLRVTGQGQPSHPLYLPSRLEPVEYREGNGPRC